LEEENFENLEILKDGKIIDLKDKEEE